jgi:hypothetical protein
MPWLEMKQNCPICRAELSDNVPTIEELKKYTFDDLKDNLDNLNVIIVDIENKNRFFYL